MLQLCLLGLPFRTEALIPQTKGNISDWQLSPESLFGNCCQDEEISKGMSSLWKQPLTNDWSVVWGRRYKVSTLWPQDETVAKGPSAWAFAVTTLHFISSHRQVLLPSFPRVWTWDTPQYTSWMHIFVSKSVSQGTYKISCFLSTLKGKNEVIYQNTYH